MSGIHLHRGVLNVSRLKIKQMREISTENDANVNQK